MYNRYLDKKLSVIPDKFKSKKPAITAWNDYSFKLATQKDWDDWEKSFTNYNLSVVCGPASGIVALDLDTDDPEILEKIQHLLPQSPVEKKGSKGWTRFFRYPTTGQNREILKDSLGNVVLEILGDSCKTTMPPSIHPNGEQYVWTSEKTLLDIDISQLPLLPPLLIPVLQEKLGGTLPRSTADYGRVSAGRNSALSSFLGKLLTEPHSLEQVIQELIKFDKDNHEVPYFSDPNEHRTSHELTNALSFYSSHMESYNSKRFREGKEYLEPALPSVKSKAPARPKKVTKEQPLVRIAPKVLDLYMMGAANQKLLGSRDNENSKN